MRIARYAAVLLVFVAPGVASAANEIVGTWTAARTGHQIRVTRTGTRTFAGAVVKAYTLGPCTNRAGRVVWTHLERVRPGRYNGTWAGYAFMTQDASTCDPNYTSAMTATIGAAFGGKLSMRVCYLPGGCTTWTRPYR
jgi:hypothetical protein